MQKFITSILFLLIMASVPVTAHAIGVSINGSLYTDPGPTIQVFHFDGQFWCSSASDFFNKGATFEFREAGDIKDMVASDVLCLNVAGPATLNIFFFHQFNVVDINTRYYFMSVQGSFFNSQGGPAQPSDLGASASVIFFNSGGQSRSEFIGFTGGNFTDSFGPQDPLQLVNLIDCAWNNCDESEIVIPVISASLAAGDGFYVFGSHHTGSAAKKEDAAAYLASLTAKIVVLNNNSVGVSTSGTVVLALLGARHVHAEVGNVDFNVRDVDLNSLRLGPLGSPGVALDGPVTYRFEKGDRIEDVRLRFPNEIDGLPLWSCSTTVAVLTGQIGIGGKTFPFTATDNVTPSPCP